MTSGKKLTFDEMKLIFGDAGSDWDRFFW
jgi:hypothetical protein